jgi:DNA ligase-1
MVESLTESGRLEDFARTAEAIAATTKKLEKAAILGAYLRTLSDADLHRATRYFAGQQFAQADARTTNVGGSIISAALSEATGFRIEDLSPRYVRLGDPGELAAEIVKEASHDLPPTITLVETESLISRLSDTRGIKNKTALLTASLRRATPLEAKYLIKLLAGDLRIGLREGLVEDAVARAFDQSLTDVAYANMLLGDIGETAVRARGSELRNIDMRLFHPIKFMLATPAADLSDVARTMPEQFLVEDKFDGIRAQAHVQDQRVWKITGAKPVGALCQAILAQGYLPDAACGRYIYQIQLFRSVYGGELLCGVYRNGKTPGPRPASVGRVGTSKLRSGSMIEEGESVLPIAYQHPGIPQGCRRGIGVGREENWHVWHSVDLPYGPEGLAIFYSNNTQPEVVSEH